MRTLFEILKNKQLDILNLNSDTTGLVRVACYYNHPITRKKYLVYFTNGLGWEHASVSTQHKCPDWDVMCRVKEIFWNDDEACVEYHPKKEDYINNNEYCLHIWRPLEAELPTPPSIMVGVKGVDQKTMNCAISQYAKSMSKQEIVNSLESRGTTVNRQMKRKAGVK